MSLTTRITPVASASLYFSLVFSGFVSFKLPFTCSLTFPIYLDFYLDFSPPITLTGPQTEGSVKLLSSYQIEPIPRINSLSICLLASISRASGGLQADQSVPSPSLIHSDYFSLSILSYASLLFSVCVCVCFRSACLSVWLSTSRRWGSVKSSGKWPAC